MKLLPDFILEKVPDVVKNHPLRWATLLIVAGSAMLLVAGSRSQADQIQTIPVDRASVTQQVVTSGNVKAGGIAEVYPEATGIVTEIYVTNNQIVEEGQELMKIESSATQAQQAQALAAYQAAVKDRQAAEQNKLLTQSQLEAARTAILDAQADIDDRDYERIYNGGNPATDRDFTQVEIDVFDSTKTSALQKFDSLEKQYKEYDQVISAAKASQQAAWKAYQATQDGVTVAPVAGTVANLLPTIGDEVIARPATTAEPVLTLTNTHAFQVTVEVREADINQIQLGQSAEVVLDALPDETFEAIVTRIDDLGRDDDGVVRYSVWLELAQPSPNIKHMMTAVVTIQTAEAENVLTIPTEALTEDETGYAVQILVDDDVVTQPIQVGLKGAKSVEVVEGLDVGDQVVVPVAAE